MTETLAYGYSFESTKRELTNEYQHDRVYIVFMSLCVLVLRMKVASALEGLRMGKSRHAVIHVRSNVQVEKHLERGEKRHKPGVMGRDAPENIEKGRQV